MYMHHIKNFLTKDKNLVVTINNILNNNFIIDHVAHRKFKNSNLLKDYIIKDKSYKLQNDKFIFKDHCASAEWFKHNLENDTKILNFKQETIDKHLDQIRPRLFISTYFGVENDRFLKKNDFDLEKINWHIQNPDQKISYYLYNDILSTNQYLAWILVHRDSINHIAFQVNDINKVLEKVGNTFEINNPDLPIQISEDKNLLQFSTTSSKKIVEFEEGKFEVPFSFIEFVERLNGRDGFSQNNANVIFNSTKH